MHDSKLLLLIKSIDTKEHNKLVEFLQWSYISKSEQISQLVKYIIKIAPDYEDKRLSKETCFQKLFPKESFDDMKLRRLMSKALKLVDKFILYQQLEKDELTQYKLWTDYYKEKDIEYFFQAKIKSWEKSNKSNDTILLFREKYLIAYQKLAYVNKQFVFKSMQKKASYDQELQKTLKELQNFYLLQAIFFRCVILQGKLSFNKKIELPSEDFMNNIREENVVHDPLIHSYYLAELMLKEPDNEERYLGLKQRLETLQKGDYRKKILIDLCKFIERYITKKCFEGNEKYYKELLDLYKYEITHELVIATSIFYPIKFRNIVVVATRVKEYEWTENFIQEYRDRLSPKQIPALPDYCLALVYFHQKKYKKADERLLKIEDADTVLMFDIKRLQLMLTYEEDNDFLLDSMMNAFRVLMSRDKFLSENIKNANQNFVNVLMRIVNVTSNDTKKIAKMEEELNSSKVFMERAWLKDKVQEKKVGKTIS